MAGGIWGAAVEASKNSSEVFKLTAKRTLDSLLWVSHISYLLL